MGSTTIRISEKKRDTLKIIASIEKREMKEILSELIDEYIERHKETLELLSKPDWLEIIERGKRARVACFEPQPPSGSRINPLS